MSRAFAGRSRPQSNRNELREVETVYNADALNAALARGAHCIVRRKELNSKLNLRGMLLRNRKSGEYIEVPAREFHQQYSCSPVVYGNDEWELVQTIKGYARRIHHESNWAAYVLPGNAKVGERFFIKDLIEDLVATEFWSSVTPAETAEAVWNGTELVIDHSSYKFVLIG
jgi:hypothetical protein